MSDYAVLLSGGDLRSIGKSNFIVQRINKQQAFDELFHCLCHQDRKVVMRAADAIEKISIAKPKFLSKHTSTLLKLLNRAENKELKWHLAQIIPRLSLTAKETNLVFKIFSSWLVYEKDSRIVRVTALQALSDLSANNTQLRKELFDLIRHKDLTAIPSLKARLKKLSFKTST